jgi:hypothetical protein
MEIFKMVRNQRKHKSRSLDFIDKNLHHCCCLKNYPQTHLVFGPSWFLQMPLDCLTSCSRKLESEQVSASPQALYPHCKKKKAPSIIFFLKILKK